MAGIDRTISVIHNIIQRGGIQCLSVPIKKRGAGNVAVTRRTGDLTLPDGIRGPYSAVVLDCLDEVFQTDRFSSYCGFDPTAPSLHLGHLPALSVLLQLAKSGRPVIALIGGATSKLGDPSGKAENRQQIDHSHLEENAERIHQQVSQIFSRYGRHHGIESSNLKIVNNATWYSEMTVEDYLKVMEKRFKLSEMLNRVVVKTRLKPKRVDSSDMRFSEFVYQTFQSYDWLRLLEDHNCCIQIGGHDQLGNIESGYTYVWRKLSVKPKLAGITVPLVITKSGEKLGKSSGNAVWLDKGMTTPDSLGQYINELSQDDTRRLALQIMDHSADNLQEIEKDKLDRLLMEHFDWLLY